MTSIDGSKFVVLEKFAVFTSSDERWNITRNVFGNCGCEVFLDFFSLSQVWLVVSDGMGQFSWNCDYNYSARNCPLSN